VSDAGPVQPGTRGLLDGLAAFGPYFAVDTHRPSGAAPPPWVPLSVLLESPAALGERAAAVRAALAAGRPPEAIEFRAAASVAQLGLTARLLSPFIAVAAAHGRVLRLDPAAVWWQPVLGGPFPLSLPGDAIRGQAGGAGGGPGVAGDPGHAAGMLRDSLLDGPVRRLVELTGGLSVSRAVLWGNVASAINGATAMIARAGPGLAGPAQVAGTALLQYGPLARAFTGTPVAGFRRRSCCLIYRASPAPRTAVCADCILARS
jgi:FhuF 2Fe-2S C-terminal domain